MKKFRLIFYVICMMFLLEVPSFAYIDPSVMTYTIQAIAGVIIAVGAVIGIVWRKAAKKAKKVLNIDDNAKKEVEDDVVEINPEDVSIEAAVTEDVEPDKSDDN
ncbi:MAG: hypothetical protein ACOX89_09880 [Lutispora sp.]|jgi:type VI protein secretion system component VasK